MNINNCTNMIDMKIIYMKKVLNGINKLEL